MMILIELGFPWNEQFSDNEIPMAGGLYHEQRDQQL